MQSVGKVIIKKKNHENYNYDQKLDTNEYFTIDTQRFSHLKANLIRFFARCYYPCNSVFCLLLL